MASLAAHEHYRPHFVAAGDGGKALMEDQCSMPQALSPDEASALNLPKRGGENVVREAIPRLQAEVHGIS
jgi:hypothetical protein